MTYVFRRPISPAHSKARLKGFTLIEMLVVMVILALTTSLLTEGLSTTWRSFERLGARSLITSSAQLPLSWFEQSLAGAVLYHPDKVLVRGNNNSFYFTTFMAPDDPKHIPQQLNWAIKPFNSVNKETLWSLSFQSELSQKTLVVQNFVSQPRFEYWNGQQWLSEFHPKGGSLPEAARIVVDGQTWAIAKIGRPALADVPIEMEVFGAYEF
jgi:general secretion pathway protein J